MASTVPDTQAKAAEAAASAQASVQSAAPAAAPENPWAGIEKVWYSGRCHCGAVTFRVLHEPLYDSKPPIPVGSCTCSICLKNGYLFIYPERHEIEWSGSTGWDGMRDYRFASETKDHKFCGTCGSSVCVDFRGNAKVTKLDILGLNARLIKDIDPEKLYIKLRNGRERANPEFNEQYW